MVSLLPDAGTRLAFLGAALALNLTPGADVMFALASGAGGGRRVGVAAALGVSLGCLVHVALTAAGVAALLAAHPAAFDAIRYAGAAYLIWLAIRAWRAGPATVEAGARGIGRAVARGALTNVLNPKVALFILAFLPQFADPARGPVWAQMLALGGIFALTAFVVTAAYGAAGGALRHALARRARWLNRIAAAVFAGLAARLVLA